MVVRIEIILFNWAVNMVRAFRYFIRGGKTTMTLLVIFLSIGKVNNEIKENLFLTNKDNSFHLFYLFAR